MGISIISGIIFLALTITATAIIYQTGVPVVQQLQAGAAVDKMKVTLSDLDSIIREVASEGQGSKRTVFISSDPGTLTINGTADTIVWELETEAPVVSPRTSQEFGNLIVGSNLAASATEGTYQGQPVFILDNSRLTAYVRRTGAPGNKTALATDGLVLAIYNKDLGTWLNNPGFLDISIDDNTNSKTGTGYTQATSLGSPLPFAEVTALMDTAYIDYTLIFRLESEADFLIIEGELA